MHFGYSEVFFLIFTLSLAWSHKLDDIPVHVAAICDDPPSLRLETNIDVEPTVICANGEKYLVPSGNGAFAIDATFYETEDDNKCEFFRIQNTSAFTVNIQVAYGHNGGKILDQVKVYPIICNDGVYARQRTLVKTGRQIRNQSPSNIVMEAYQEDGTRVRRSVTNGTNIYLEATIENTDMRVGLRPISCDAVIASSGVRFPVLRSGCASGKSIGFFKEFTIRGNTARSPYFKMRHIEGNNVLRFECAFALCRPFCYGSSCYPRRRKRSSGFRVFTSTSNIIVE